MVENKAASSKASKYLVSVVIPTLGGEYLKQTIESLNTGTIVPKEILICIPEELSHRVETIRYKNVSIVKTEFRGQVKQRIEGFVKVTCEHVMQLDDDIILDNECVEHLVDVFDKHGSSISVSPTLINQATNASVYKRNRKNCFIEAIYFWVMNGAAGYQPGQVDKTGTPVGIEISEDDVDCIDVEWLAGGCVMHHKDNLVLDNYFPFNGKAFGEDVMHSLKLKEKGVKLYIQPKSKCYLELVPMTATTCSDFLINLKSEIRIRKHYMKSVSEESIRIDIYYILTVIRFLIKKLIINLKK